MHQSSYSKMNWFKNSYLSCNKSLNILDVGSLDKTGSYNYKSIFDCSNWKYTGLDMLEGNNVDIVVNDIYNWEEISDNSYDVVISGQFFEHLKFFWQTMAEIKRVLKPGGYVCIITPSDGPNHGTMEVYNRFQIDDLIKLADYFDFEVIHVSVNKDAEPWHDACLVAKKSMDNNELKYKLNALEKKMESFSNFKQLIMNMDKF